MTVNKSDRRERPYVDGQWQGSDETIGVRDLTTDESFATVEATTDEQARRALSAAAAAQEAMAEKTQVERAELLEAIADELRAREAELSETIVREAGKPISSARGSVDGAAERFERAADEARTFAQTYGEYREGSTTGHEGWRAIVKPEPVGTVLCITPYNYPLETTALQVAPALAAGNCVLLKPASNTPVTAAILTDIVASVTDLPSGAFNYVPGHGSEIGDVLAGSEAVDAIAMTGSTGAGKHVARESGIVQLHMELGGNAPAVVFPDADLEATVDACASGSFKYSGQRCSAVSRVLAHESVHDEVVEGLESRIDRWETGDLFEESTDFGPLISPDQAAWVEELVEDALDSGADLVCGGDRDGAFFEPTLLANVPQDARIVHEEQFGPVAAVTAFTDEAEALATANSGDLALDASVFTADYDRAMRFAEQIDAGSVRVNGRPSHGIGDIPFGGNDDSGIGREGIHATIEAMVRTKSIIL